MSLGIALKGPEGLVMAADSRVTLFNQLKLPTGQQVLFPASFDNASKLLKFKGHDFVAAVTYGAGAIGLQQPRTAHSFLPEFETELGTKRLSVEEFATRLGAFYMKQWKAAGMLNPLPADGQDMVFLIGGYDEDAAYGRVVEVHIPTNPLPVERVPTGQFGAVWGGQRNLVDRILQGFDPEAVNVFCELTGIADKNKPPDLEAKLKARLSMKVPVQFLPLQDCVDLTIFLIRATILAQNWVVDLRGVGGAVDVATITRTEGFRPVQLKQIVGESII
jgi:hypothetical protein